MIRLGLFVIGTNREALNRAITVGLLILIASVTAYGFCGDSTQSDIKLIRIDEFAVEEAATRNGSPKSLKNNSSGAVAGETLRAITPIHRRIYHDPYVRRGSYLSQDSPPKSPQLWNKQTKSLSAQVPETSLRGTPPSVDFFELPQLAELDKVADGENVSVMADDRSGVRPDDRQSREAITPLEFDYEYNFESKEEEELPSENSRRVAPVKQPELSVVAPLEALKDLITSTPLTNSPSVLYWSLDDAINAALHYSFRIDSLRIEAFESFHDIGIEFGRFDSEFFLEQRLGESNRPVGNNFESDGSAARVRGQESSLRWGLRKELLSGGRIELNDSTELRDDDSGVLNPPNQARSGINVAFSQPLLRGSGKSIAMNQVLIAAHNAHAVKLRSTSDIASLVKAVSDAYWDLYIARGQILATLESIELSKATVADLEGRQQFDADTNILEQARRTVTQLRIQLRQQTGSLRNAQIELAVLVNAPELVGNITEIEIVPVENIVEDFNSFDLPTLVASGISNRPEIQEALEQVKAAALENHLSLNQLLPELNFILDASFDGLAGNRDIASAARNRFDSSGTYSVGFDVNVPLANRTARFQKRKNELALARLNREFQNTVEQVKRDVRFAANQMEVSDQQWSEQKKVVQSIVASLQNLEARQFRAPREGSDSAFQLTQILDAQSQISSSKSAFIEALANREKAVVDLNLATGILVNQVDAGLPHAMERNRPLMVYRNFRDSRDAYLPHADRVSEEARTASRPSRLTQRRAGSRQFGYPTQSLYSDVQHAHFGQERSQNQNVLYHSDAQPIGTAVEVFNNSVGLAAPNAPGSSRQVFRRQANSNPMPFQHNVR